MNRAARAGRIYASVFDYPIRTLIERKWDGPLNMYGACSRHAIVTRYGIDIILWEKYVSINLRDYEIA